MKAVLKLTWYEGDLADQHPLVWEEELHHHVLAVLPMQVDAHVPRVLHHPVRHVDVVNSPVIPKFSLLIGKINLQRAFIIVAINLSFWVGFIVFCWNFAAKVDCLKNKWMFLGAREDLYIFCVVIVNVDEDLVKFSDIHKCEIHLQRTHALILPSDPLVAWKWNTLLIQTFSFWKFQIWSVYIYLIWSHDQILAHKNMKN